MATGDSSNGSEVLGHVLNGLTSVSTLLTSVERLSLQVSELTAKVTELSAIQPSVRLPDGFIDPPTFAARKFVTVKEAAFILTISEKSVRRLIQRGKLSASNALRKKLIPVDSIITYQRRTVQTYRE